MLQSLRTAAFLVATAFLATHTIAPPCRASEAAGDDQQLVSLFESCDGDTAARIRFIEDSLGVNRGYARYYRNGWLGFYTIGVGFSSYRASTNERGERAVQILSAIKAVGGVARILIRPPNAKEGEDASRALPSTNPAECRRRLEVAEETLQLNARQAGQRWDWKPHVINAAIHVTGAVIVAETWGARRDAWGQAVLGELFGEAIIWSFPWQAADVLEEYERRFPASGLPPEPRVGWGLAPTVGGGAFVVRF